MDIEIDESRFKTASSLMFSEENYDLDLELQSQNSCLKVLQIKDVSESPVVSDPSSNSTKSKRKYVKKTASKFLETKVAYDQFRSAQLQSYPIYQNLKENIQFILIAGDFLINLNSYIGHYSHSQISHFSNDSPIILETEEGINIYKDIVQVSKSDQFITVKLTNKMNGIVDFRRYIQMINNLMISVSGQCNLNILVQFQEYLEKCISTVTRIISLYPNYNDLIALQQRRTEYIKQLGAKSLQKYNMEEDFLGMGLSLISFHTRVPTLENISFSKKLVELIGTNFDSLQAYFMRRGLREFFDFETRIVIQQQNILAILRKQNEFIIHPFTLITFDNYRIKCRIQLESLFTELPNHLKYDKQGEDHFILHEGGFIMKVLISQQQINEIQRLRNEAKQQDIQHDQHLFTQENDIGYSMQSQYLIEKYYPGDLKKIMKNSDTEQDGQNTDIEEEQQIKQEQSDPYSEIRCKYKPVQIPTNQP